MEESSSSFTTTTTTTTTNTTASAYNKKMDHKQKKKEKNRRRRRPRHKLLVVTIVGIFSIVIVCWMMMNTSTTTTLNLEQYLPSVDRTNSVIVATTTTATTATTTTATLTATQESSVIVPVLQQGLPPNNQWEDFCRENTSTTTNSTSSSSSVLLFRRCQPMPLARPNNKFSYVHISKTGGFSWIEELKRLKQVPKNHNNNNNFVKKYGLYPLSSAGLEHGVFWQDEYLKQNYFFQDHYFHRLVTLRSPRHHIFSMFRMCYYSDWGKKTTANSSLFPRGGGGGGQEEDDHELTDLERWLDLFLDENDPETILDDQEQEQRRRNYKILPCYDPRNYQARALMSHERNPRRGMITFQNNNVNVNNSTTTPTTPPEQQQIENVYWSFDWVSLTSFFHESKCLLYYRLDTRGASPMISQMVSKYLNETCHCSSSTTSSSSAADDADDAADAASQEYKDDIKFQHYVVLKDEQGNKNKGSTTTLLNSLPPRILHKMDILSRFDTAVYQTALYQFLKEMVWLESNLGRRVLCDPVMGKLGIELSYLPLLLQQQKQQEYGRTSKSPLSTLYTEVRRLAPSSFKEY